MRIDLNQTRPQAAVSACFIIGLSALAADGVFMNAGAFGIIASLAIIGAGCVLGHTFWRRAVDRNPTPQVPNQFEQAETSGATGENEPIAPAATSNLPVN